MKDQLLKIIFKDDMAFLTEEVALDYTQVKISDYQIKLKAPAYWTIRVLNYLEAEKKLAVDMIGFGIGKTTFSPDQLELADILMGIETVTFRKVDTNGFVSTFNIVYAESKTEREYIKHKYIEPQTREPIKETYTEPFSVLIKNVTFISGGVTFEKRIQQLGRSIKFHIPNQNIIKEYDAIKNYFERVLKTKSIQVHPEVITVDGRETSVKAMSAEIDKIDASLFEEVKFDLITVARKKEAPGDQEIFTKEEFLGNNISQFFKDDDDFINLVLEKSGTKHHNHLRLLSSKQRHDLIKLRLIQTPFAFLFLVSGKDNFHVVWETLDTEEATYIWSFIKDQKILKQNLMRIDKTISSIVRSGKSDYISQYEEGFNRVRHDYTDLHNGFRKWKEDIEKVILK